MISIKLKSNRLLELGFEHFVRVGSVKRIHKKIAPYVLQHQECETSNFLKHVIVYLIQIVNILIVFLMFGCFCSIDLNCLQRINNLYT